MILDSIIETIKDHIRVGEVIKIKGLGTFELKEQKSTRRRDINTGELFDVPEKKKLVFTPSPLIDVNKKTYCVENE